MNFRKCNQMTSEEPLYQLKQLMDNTILGQLIPLLPNERLVGFGVCGDMKCTRVWCAGHNFTFNIQFDKTFTERTIRKLYPECVIPKSPDYAYI